jgi:hypothetical protein
LRQGYNHFGRGHCYRWLNQTLHGRLSPLLEGGQFKILLGQSGARLFDQRQSQGQITPGHCLNRARRCGHLCFQAGHSDRNIIEASLVSERHDFIDTRFGQRDLQIDVGFRIESHREARLFECSLDRVQRVTRQRCLGGSRQARASNAGHESQSQHGRHQGGAQAAGSHGRRPRFEQLTNTFPTGENWLRRTRRAAANGREAQAFGSQASVNGAPEPDFGAAHRALCQVFFERGRFVAAEFAQRISR